MSMWCRRRTSEKHSVLWQGPGQCWPRYKCRKKAIPLVRCEPLRLDGVPALLHEQDRRGPLNAARPVLVARRMRRRHRLAVLVDRDVEPVELGRDGADGYREAALRDDVVPAPLLHRGHREGVVYARLVVQQGVRGAASVRELRGHDHLSRRRARGERGRERQGRAEDV